MKQLSNLLLLLSTILMQESNAQRKSALTRVDVNNKINGQPFIILPQTAVKFKFSIYEYSYKRGEKLDLLIKHISLNKPECTDLIIKESLSILEKKYDVNLDVLLEFIKQKQKKDTVILKMDKTIAGSFISAADYTKIFKYQKFKATSNSSLNLVYDENGILVSSKQTSEDKLLPTIVSAASSAVSLATTILKNATIIDDKQRSKDTCITINEKFLGELDKRISEYAAYLKKGNVYLDKHFEKGKEKHEEEIAKEFADLFYSKEVRNIPIEITFIIPRDKIPQTNSLVTYNLFAYDKAKGRILLNEEYKQYLLATPFDRTKDTLLPKTGVYKFELSTVQQLFDRHSNISALTDTSLPKKTAVFNIPKSERVRLLKPTGSESFIDTIIKVPQHGSLGYYGKKFSSIELTYDANGELKSFTGERKSALDTNITASAGAAKEVITFFKPKSEMELLKEKADKLELEKKIRDLEKDKEQ